MRQAAQLKIINTTSKRLFSIDATARITMAIWLKTQVLVEPILVGRESELQELGQYLDFATQGKGTTILVSGEAGAGKSRLVREFLKTASQKKAGILIGSCLSDSASPYFPFSTAFRSYFNSLEQESLDIENCGSIDVSRFGKGTGFFDLFTQPIQLPATRIESISPQVWKEQIFANVVQTLDVISAKQSIILLLEDIQWADSASLSLLHYLARAINGSKPIIIIGTYRSDELNADTEGHPRPLTEAMRHMRREDLFHEIFVKGLNQIQITQIAENMIGGNVQSQLGEKLTTESKGNPLFIVESIRMLHESQKLVQRDNEWILTATEVGIPSKIKDIILSRLAVLTFSQRRILDAASVVGEKFEIKLLSDVLGLDSLEVLETLNVIAQTTSIVYAEGDSYRFDHARSRETLYGELSVPLKQGYHAKIAEKLENKYAKSKLPYSELAYHYAQAGNKEIALRYALAAGQDSLSRFSNVEAIKHFTYALANMPENCDITEKTKALEGLADAYYANNMFREASKLYEHLSETQTGVVRLRAFRKAMDVAFFSRESQTHLMELAQKAEVYASSDRFEYALLLMQKGRAKVQVMDYKTTYEYTTEALKIFEEEFALPQIASGLLGLGILNTFTSKYQEKAFGQLLCSLALSEELGDIRKKIDIQLWLADGFLRCSLIDQALDKYQEIIELGNKIGDFQRVAQATAQSAYCYLRKDDAKTALSTSLKAIAYGNMTDINWIIGRFYAHILLEYLKLGDLEHAEEYYPKILNLNPVNQRLYVVEVLIAKAVYFTAKNRFKEANECIAKMFEFRGRSDIEVTEYGLILLHEATLSLKKQGQIQQAKKVSDEYTNLLAEVEKRWRQANIRAEVILPINLQQNKEIEMRFLFANVSVDNGKILNIDQIVPQTFEYTDILLDNKRIDKLTDLAGITIGPFATKIVKLKLRATTNGQFLVAPSIEYLDSFGNTKTYVSEPKTITVSFEQEALPDKITSGSKQLDELFSGGIPKEYAIVLLSPPCNTEEYLINGFIAAGPRLGESTFYITAKVDNTLQLAKANNPYLKIFLCNPASDKPFEGSGNVVKLRGIENLTEINIELLKAIRSITQEPTRPKRACIDLLSDVLLQHHTVITRKWLTSILQDLKSNGFTTLIALNPKMHQPEVIQAVLGLFEGEIQLGEKENEKNLYQTIRINRLSNLQYSNFETPI
jgi:predicted ATPase/KaiC/GvpD/RAD55 family RecA-like ATPase